MLPANPQLEYLRQRVSGASPLELILMLYQAAVENVDQAVEALRSGDILRRGQLTGKAIEIVSELRLSLRREVDPAYCDTLSGLYSYIQQQLLRAHAEKSESFFLEVSRLLKTLLEGWVGAMKNLEGARRPSSAPGEGPSEHRYGVVQPVRSSSGYSEEGPDEANSSTRSWRF